MLDVGWHGTVALVDLVNHKDKKGQWSLQGTSSTG